MMAEMQMDKGRVASHQNKVKQYTLKNGATKVKPLSSYSAGRHKNVIYKN